MMANSISKDIIDKILPTKCEQLAGKPKLIFVQACQGDETDAGSVVYGSASQPECFQVNATRGRLSAIDEEAIYCIPNYADLLVFQASYKGHFAFRSSSGSWFIQTVCEVIDESGDNEDLSSVLTRAARKISQRKSNTTARELDQKMQMPMRQDTLIRKVYLKTNNPSQFSNGATTRSRDNLTEELPLTRVQSSNDRQNNNDDGNRQNPCACM